MAEDAVVEESVDATPAADTAGVDDVASSQSTDNEVDLSKELAGFRSAIDSESSDLDETPAPGQVATGERPAVPAGDSRTQQQPQSPYTAEDFRYAQALGIGQQQLAGMDPNVFRQLVNNVGNMLHQARVQQTQTPPQQQQQPVQYTGFQPYKLPGDESMYDDGVRNAVAHFNQHFDGMHRYYQQQLAAMQPAIQQFQQYLPHIVQMQQAAAKNQQQTFYDQFDSVLDRFDESIVGRGKVSAITDQSQKEARKAVAMQVEKEIAYHSRNGDAMPPLEDMVKRAFYGLYHDRVTQQQAAIVKGKVSDRLNQTTVAPSRTANRATRSDDDLSEVKAGFRRVLSGK